MTDNINIHPLIPAYPSDEHWSGIATTPHGRIFVSLNRALNENGPRIAELLQHQHIVPYPNAQWNLISPERELLYTFVSIQSMRLSANGNLWVLDKGCNTDGCMVKDSAKLVEIELNDNIVKSVIPLNGVLHENSRLKDMCIGSEYIYLSDVGVPALIAVNLSNGYAYRLAERTEKKSHGVELEILRAGSNIDNQLASGGHLEISKDGNFLFLLTIEGSLRRYRTDGLLDLEDQGKIHRKKGDLLGMIPNGMLGMDAVGNLFLIDRNTSSILGFDSSGSPIVLLEDSVLSDADGMWVDHEDFLWVTIDRQAAEKNQKNEEHVIGFPVYLFKLPRS